MNIASGAVAGDATYALAPYVIESVKHSIRPNDNTHDHGYAKTLCTLLPPSKLLVINGVRRGSGALAAIRRPIGLRSVRCRSLDAEPCCTSRELLHVLSGGC